MNKMSPFRVSIVIASMLIFILSSCSQKILTDNRNYSNHSFYLNWKNDSLKFEFNPKKLNCVINNYTSEKNFTLYYNRLGVNISKNQFLKEYGKKELIQIQKTILRFEKNYIRDEIKMISYLNLIETADDSLKFNNFKSALKNYTKAHQLLRNEPYPLSKIKQIKSIVPKNQR